MQNKFKLRTDLKLEKFGITFFRIELLVDLFVYKKGDLLGYLEKESNLSQSGNALVYGDACVHGNACVHGDARVFGDARVYGDALVYGDAHVFGDARVYGDARVFDNACVHGDALVFGNARVYGDALVFGDARVHGDALVYGDARVYGDALVFGNARVEKYGQCVSINNQKNNITITPNKILIGCKLWDTFKDFENTYQEIGKSNNYTDDEILMTYEIVKSIHSRMSPINKTIKIEHNGQSYEIDLSKAKELGIIKE